MGAFVLDAGIVKPLMNSSSCSVVEYVHSAAAAVKNLFLRRRMSDFAFFLVWCVSAPILHTAVVVRRGGRNPACCYSQEAVVVYIPWHKPVCTS